MATKWRAFLAGMLCGITLMVGVGWVWSMHRSAEEDASYDSCLISYRGNTVICDAVMRASARDAAKRAAEAAEEAKLTPAERATRQKIQVLLDAGAPKREIVQWAREKAGSTLSESDLAKAIGISLKDIQDGNY